ncbi:hydroxyisourate hydrolase [Acinetobacter sp. COS3]|uniref:hydroxyisourate hydrolase n=1 Tax=Acinetobacter sp. COS3 TaxID=1397525 RepID=UPI0003B905C3|nr:hydroxyisourate hydrolase [Acinetobacter sp. COS3]ERS01092.1 hydroxyisourate hydrolase [Acinetobacter sp. COS3]
MIKALVPVSAIFISSFSFAQNPLSVHVLNLENGLPSAGVKVILEKQEKDQWKELSKSTTNQQGRITALYPQDTPFEKGIYKVTFKTGEWFQKNKQSSFFPEVPVIFSVDGKLEHYHIPLLISPYGYSTYRGN